MSNAIDDLPTEAEREAARKIVAVMEPLSVADRHKVLRRLAKHFPDLRFGWSNTSK